MDAIVGMLPDISVVIFQAPIQSFSVSKIVTHVRTDIRIEAWKAEDSRDFNTRFGETGSS